MDSFLELKNFLTEKAASLNIKILKFSFWKGKKSFQVNIIVEHESGNTNVGHCQQIFNLSKMWLKNEDLLNSTYLNVESTSIDREMYSIEDYEKYINNKITIELNDKNEDNQKHFIGFIKNVKCDVISIENENEIKTFKFDEIKKAKLIPDWDQIKKGIK